MDIFKIFAAAILVLFLIMILRESKSTLVASLKCTAIVCFAAAAIVTYIPLYRQVLTMTSKTALAQYMPVLVRSLGVAVLTRICSDVCREGGEGGLAFCVETVGKLEMLIIALPLVEELISIVGKLLEI